METNFNYNIQLATKDDIDEIDCLYEALHYHLETHVNYPGWKRGIYPTREDAIEGVQNCNLFVLRIGGEIAGEIVLNHKPEQAYENAKWQIDVEYSEVIVIHTFAVHPKFQNRGIAQKLLQFAKEYSIENNMKCIRLDVSVNNKPAIALYEKFGFQYIDTVDLGLNIPDLIWFKLYEIVL